MSDDDKYHGEKQTRGAESVSWLRENTVFNCLEVKTQGKAQREEKWALNG